ncbi:MAG: GWxTD domain-containing protein [Acidobacteriota bacterium]
MTCLLFSLFLSGEEKLIPRHQEWLETVDPIITDKEREVFLQLKTSEQRDKFITLFWNRRDPLPDTKKNEFYEEYMERVRYANRNFGRDTAKKGSQTERGAFYLLLGPPVSREIHTGSQDLLPLELWTYSGEVQYGLPNLFYLIFFQPHGLGEYRLYSPGVDGPARLLSPSVSVRTMNRSQAYQIIRRSAGELAKASLSYVPEDSSLMVSSLSSDILIGKIHELPEKKHTDSYAEDFLKLEDHVETDYLDDYIENDFSAKVFKIRGQDYLHWTLEPKKINLATYQGKTYASFQMIIRIEDMKENLVLEKNEEIPLTISPEDYERYNRRIFAFQDIIPVIPGQYKLFLLLKNKTGKDFTSTQLTFSVPDENSSLQLSDLLLYQDRQALKEDQKNKIKAFSFSGYHYLANAQNNCVSQKSIGIYAQVYNLQETKNISCSLEIYSAESEKPEISLVKPISELLEPDGQGLNIGPVSISSVKPGYYHAQLSVLDEERHKILEKKVNFVIISQPQPIIPWVYSKMHNAPPDYEHFYLLASQHYRKGQYVKAEQMLEKILTETESQQAEILLAQTLLAMKRHRESLAIVKPIYEKTQSQKSAVVTASNYAGLQDWESALVYLEKLLKQSSDLDVLNLAAECYIKLNKPERALPLLKKSLNLDPNQEKIQQLINQIEKE